MTIRHGRLTGLLSVTAAAALALTACGDDGGNGNGNGNGEGDGEGGTITLGIIPSWTDGLSTAHLWEAILEDEGYEVEIEEISDAAPLYTGVANGDFDVYPSAWPEVTHADYMEEYGDDLEDLGAYYENAKLTFAVPEYTDIESIEDLNDNVDMFDGRVVGIEPGAGLTDITKESVFPEYELGDNYELVESSTASMLAELRDATSNEEDIVVTLWRPFWANTEFDMKDLEDPEEALGEAETLNSVAHAGFSEEFPEVADMMSNFSLDDDQYGQLEDMIVNDYEGEETEGARAWLEENPDFVDSLKE